MVHCLLWYILYLVRIYDRWYLRAVPAWQFLEHFYCCISSFVVICYIILVLQIATHAGK